MPKFSSTAILMELLKGGEYKRLIMENDGDGGGLGDSGSVLIGYQERISHHHNYDYLINRKNVEGEDSKSEKCVY